MSTPDLSNMSLIEMFKLDAESHLQALSAGLLGLEQHPDNNELIDACMRAAHSIKGGARVVGLNAGVKVAHAMEDCFVSAQEGNIQLRTDHIDLLLQGVDILQHIANTPETEMAMWESGDTKNIQNFLLALTQAPQSESKLTASTPNTPAPTARHEESETQVPQAVANAYRAMRVNPENLNRLLALAGEALVGSQWLTPFAASLQRLKAMQYAVETEFSLLADELGGKNLDNKTQIHIYSLKQQLINAQNFLNERLTEISLQDRQSVNLSHRLYAEALTCRMRPFSDITISLPRMVRDLGRSLGKDVVLRIEGENTQVDRDILQKLEAPLGHLLRNAVDHGLEAPIDRLLANKHDEGVIRLEACHQAGMLLVTVSDDGRGIDLDKLRQAILNRGFSDSETIANFTTSELLEFLFLPGFTLSDKVTDISGRGVGLDAVQEMLKQVRGTVQISTEQGKGTAFSLRLPLTLSVLRALVVEISGEPYAFPLAQISHALKIQQNDIELLEGRQYFRHYDRNIGLIPGYQVLELRTPEAQEGLSVVVFNDGDTQYGMAVSKFLGEQELVVQRLDMRLGKIPNIASGALLKDGSPVLIIDVKDIIRSIAKLIGSSPLSKAYQDVTVTEQLKRKRVLVVDDSLTVRELERKLLTVQGYEVAIAVDGMDGWNAVRTGHFDLVISDIDMPRMDGIEFVSLIKKHPTLKKTPVMIVSYKDRESDRQRGLEAGADYYLPKSSFQDRALLQAVTDLIGGGRT